MGVVGLFFVVKQSNEAAVAGASLTNALANLGTSNSEISREQKETSRIEAENTQLQERLLEQGRTISELAKQGISTTTGGDSFCLMNFDGTSMTQNAGLPVFLHVGKYPLYDITARIDDMGKIARLMREDKMPFFTATASSEVIIAISHIAVGGAYNSAMAIPFERNTQARSFNIFFDARNGFWSEELRFHIVGGTWRVAYRMTNKDPKTGKRVEFVDKEFPRGKTGDVDWNGSEGQ